MRLLHAGFLGDPLADGFTWIIDAVHNHGPTVILAGFRRVNLIAAARAMPGFPQLARHRIYYRAFAALSKRADLKQRAGRVEERIAGVGLPSGDVDHLAQIIVEFLRHVPRRSG